MANLPDDFWMHDEGSQSLIGKRTRKSYQLAQMVDVRLLEARPVTGGLLFTLDSAGIAARGPQPGKRPNRKGASKNARSAEVKPAAKHKPKRRR
jgi:ribonuclease R